ncbi:MAG: peptidoglycan DD-metalloendopeptidase family protein [Clostridiales bacterium]|nr:peptidoglycan DD-metalloendopeptidase family protein [Clostridiales bacterium]
MIAGVLSLSFIMPTYATDLSDAQQKAQQLEEQKKAAESEKSSLAEQLNTIVTDMKKSEEDMTKKESEIEKAEEELVNAKVDEQNQYESMKKRIKYIYENGSSEFLEIMLEAKDMADFLNKAEYATKMSEYDRDMLKKFQKLVKKVEEEEAKLNKEYEELHTLQASLTEKQTAVETLLTEKASEIASIESEMTEVQGLITAAKEAERRRQEAEEAAKQQAQQNNGNSGGSAGDSVVSGNGFFTHPCPGMSYQSSYFGEVREGIGDSRPHKGHDYAAAPGTPIYAAAAGKVTTAGYSNSAGYWVVINHGNGLVTKYMHMWQMPYVSEGQTVEKGQNIGGVGTTGQSTGNHLHFQVELNGVPVNPSNYM